MCDRIQCIITRDQDNIKTNILSKYEEDWVKTVVARVLTKLKKICPSDVF